MTYYLTSDEHTLDDIFRADHARRFIGDMLEARSVTAPASANPSMAQRLKALSRYAFALPVTDMRLLALARVAGEVNTSPTVFLSADDWNTSHMALPEEWFDRYTAWCVAQASEAAPDA